MRPCVYFPPSFPIFSCILASPLPFIPASQYATVHGYHRPHACPIRRQINEEPSCRFDNWLPPHSEGAQLRLWPASKGRRDECTIWMARIGCVDNGSIYGHPPAPRVQAKSSCRKTKMLRAPSWPIFVPPSCIFTSSLRTFACG
ncbi:hypothetical protein C8R44DRAFT_762283 [Mycena epipterygia]|nr:hypothetical protein C8R44DRAFT_762283 [Mycena epipterygia]